MIKLGFAGTGYINAVHLKAAKNINNVSPSAVFSRDKKRAENFADEFDIKNCYDNYDEMLNSDIDAVVIGLPTPLHKDFTIKAFQKSKHVLCEKPIALNIDDAILMKNAAEKSGKILMIAHVLRFWSEYRAVKKMFDEGAAGKIKKIYAYRIGTTPQWSSGNWLLNNDQSGGVPVDLQIHDIDFIRWLLGEPKKIYAAGVKNADGLIINSTSIFQYDDATAVAEAGIILSKNFRFQMGFKIITDKAVIEYSNLNEPSLSIETENGKQQAIQIENSNPYTNQLLYFVKCLEQNKEPDKIKASDAIESLRLALKIHSLISY